MRDQPVASDIGCRNTASENREPIATQPITGHILPALPIARKLVERGHEVAWYAGKKFQVTIEATNFTYGYDSRDRLTGVYEGTDTSVPLEDIAG